MANSLETRCPLLDHRVTELAWRLPMAMKIRPGHVTENGRWAMRHILNQYLRSELFDRPQMGYGIPIGSWFRGPLRSWASDFLYPAGMQHQVYLRPEPIQRSRRQHLSGRFDHTIRLLTVLMLQVLLEEWG
jgi:asparagine synthase (glutamine-hydrolysing)